MDEDATINVITCSIMNHNSGDEEGYEDEPRSKFT